MHLICDNNNNNCTKEVLKVTVSFVFHGSCTVILFTKLAEGIMLMIPQESLVNIVLTDLICLCFKVVTQVIKLYINGKKMQMTHPPSFIQR